MNIVKTPIPTTSWQEVYRLTHIARTSKCEFNDLVNEYYNNIISAIVKRANDGYTDFNLNAQNTSRLDSSYYTEVWKTVAYQLATLNKFNVTFYWMKNDYYRCHSIHVDWETEGSGTLKEGAY